MPTYSYSLIEQFIRRCISGRYPLSRKVDHFDIVDGTEASKASAVGEEQG